MPPATTTFPYRTTSQVAKLLGLSYPGLHSLMQRGKLDPLPAKDPGGRYFWTEDDVARARAAAAVDRRFGPRKRREAAAHAG